MIARFIATRVAALAIAVLVIATGVFFLTRVLPGDPAQVAAGLGASPEAIAKVRERMGLDEPLGVQYLTFLGQLLRFDLGNSLTNGQPIAEQVLGRLPATLELVVLAVLLYVPLAILLGLRASRPSAGMRADTVRIATTLFAAVPVYWLAMVAQLVLAFQLGWFPSGGRLPTGASAPPDITGSFVIDGLLTGRLDQSATALYHLILPAVCLMLGMLGVLTRLMTTQARDVRRSDFVRTAHAHGIAPERVERITVLPNAVNPLVTVVGMQIAFLVAGTIFVERIFRWPGLGSYTWDAITRLDYNSITAVVIVLTLVFAATTLAVDVLHRTIDPRIGFHR